MTILVLLGFGVAAGLALIGAAVVPARREPLAVTIARLDALTANPEPPAPLPAWWQARVERLTVACERSSRGWWTIPTADLMVLGRTPLAFTTRRLIAAGVGLLAAAVLSAGIVPAGQVLLAGVARAASRSRAEFVAAVAVLCDLTAQERDAGRAPAQAIVESAAVAQGWVCVLVRARLRSAQRLAHTPWEALTALADQLQVRELTDLAEIIATASDGAAISKALRDKATALRATAIQADITVANSRVEWLVWPVTLLVVGMLLLVLRGIAAQFTIS
jgi:hypothetical protein